jgi:hypothetical protein
MAGEHPASMPASLRALAAGFKIIGRKWPPILRVALSWCPAAKLMLLAVQAQLFLRETASDIPLAWSTPASWQPPRQLSRLPTRCSQHWQPWTAAWYSSAQLCTSGLAGATDPGGPTLHACTLLDSPVRCRGSRGRSLDSQRRQPGSLEVAG